MSDLTNAEKRAICFEFYDWLRSHVATSLVVARSDVEAEVLRMYPDPTPEPTIVTLKNGLELRINVDGRVEHRLTPDGSWMFWQPFTASDFAAFGEIAQEYYQNQRGAKP